MNTFKAGIFYNKIPKLYVLIELKATKLVAEEAGQLNMNYYENEVHDEDDNNQIGIKQGINLL